MDFVLGILITKQGVDSIFIIVDQFSKMAHFVPCKSSNDAFHNANKFFKKLVRIHGFMTSIVSNRDVKFQGHFWRTLWKKLGTNLSFSFAYQPQTYG